MISIIAKRRFLSNIMTLRFSICFVLCEILFVFSTIILTQDYTERLVRYQNSVQSNQRRLSEINTYSRLRVGLDRPPSSLSILCEGADKRLGTSLTVAFDKAPTITERGGIKNPLLAVFPSIDLTTVIQIILSLVVLLFAYNTISGERENGTLQQVLSNNIPRHVVLLGNFVGGMATVALPLVIGLISSLIIIIINPMVVLSANDLIRIFMVFSLALFFLSAFYSLGMLLSSRVRRSATVLVLILFIWVVFTIVLPNIAVYLGKHLVSMPDRAVIDREAHRIFNDWEEKMDQYAEKDPWPPRSVREQMKNFTPNDIQFIRGLERGRSVWTGNWPYAFQYLYGPKELVQWYYDGSIYGHNLRMEHEDLTWQLYKDYQSRLQKQMAVARILSLFSPSWVFYRASSTIAATSEVSYLRFLDQAQDYRRELIQYMKNKGGLDTYLLFTRKPVESFLTIRELLAMRDTQGEKAVKEIVNYRFDPLDLSDLPRFRFLVPGLRKSIVLALPEILILVFLNLVFFSAAWVSFIRADVR